VHIQSAWFAKFWSNYYPSSQRRHSINRGEVGLTKSALANGVRISAYVNSEMLNEEIVISGVMRVSELTQLVDPPIASRWLAGLVTAAAGASEAPRVSGAGSYGTAPQSLAYIQEQVRFAFSNLNVTQVLGLASTRLLGAPLKLDLCRNGCATIGQYILLLQESGVSPDEADELRAYLEGVGTPSSYRLPFKKWRALGLM
jgi:hypothetical protein